MPNRRLSRRDFGVTALCLGAGIMGGGAALVLDRYVAPLADKAESKTYAEVVGVEGGYDLDREFRRIFFLIPVGSSDSNSPTGLCFARDNPVYDEKGLVRVVKDYNPSVHPRMDAIREGITMNHLVGHKISGVTPEGIEGHARCSQFPVDWSPYNLPGFDFDFDRDCIFEGQRSKVLKIVSPDKVRDVQYIDLGGNGVVNRLVLGKRGMDDELVDLDTFENRDLQHNITMEYRWLFKRVAQFGSDWGFGYEVFLGD
jgi:hypothetical protein